MQVQRAQEILTLNNKITVELNGESVWIESVDAQMETAKIHNEANPAVAKTVSLEALKEVR